MQPQRRPPLTTISPNARSPAPAAGAGMKPRGQEPTPGKEKVWVDLTPPERAAAKTLGWDDEATWDAFEVTSVCSSAWAALGERERAAAKTLGWDEATWDGEMQEATEEATKAARDEEGEKEAAKQFWNTVRPLPSPLTSPSLASPRLLRSALLVHSLCAL